MIGRFSFLTLVLIGLTSAGEVLAQQQPLTETELREAIVGKSIRWSSGNVTDYRADGTFTFNRGGKPTEGTWTMAGNKICYSVPSIRSSPCDQFYKDAKGPYNVDFSGKQSRFTVDGAAR